MTSLKDAITKAQGSVTFGVALMLISVGIGFFVDTEEDAIIVLLGGVAVVGLLIAAPACWRWVVAGLYPAAEYLPTGTGLKAAVEEAHERLSPGDPYKGAQRWRPGPVQPSDGHAANKRYKRHHSELKAIRNRTGLRPVAASEEGKAVTELPGGVWGDVVLMIGGDVLASHVGRSGLDWPLELHKAEDGEV